MVAKSVGPIAKNPPDVVNSGLTDLTSVFPADLVYSPAMRCAGLALKLLSGANPRTTGVSATGTCGSLVLAKCVSPCTTNL